MAFVDETPDLTPAEQEAARSAFLADPSGSAGEPTGTPGAPSTEDAALEAEALEELTQPPVAPGVPPAPAAPGAPGTPAPQAVDPYAQYGGEQAVRDALGMSQAMRTEQGIRALIANGITTLYGPEAVARVQSALAGPAQEVETHDPFEGLDPDEPLTAGQVRDLWVQFQESQRAEAQQLVEQSVTPLQQAQAEQMQTAVRNVTDASVIAILGPVPEDPEARQAYAQQVDAIVDRGLRYYDPSQWNNPQHIQQAIQRANAELTQESEQRFQAYLATKRQTRNTAPPNISSGAGGEGPLPEPKNLDEARKQLRESGFFG